MNKVYVTVLLILVGCELPLETEPRIPTYIAYDFTTGEIPMPNDVLRDEEEGHLNLPTDDDDLSPTERDLRLWLNTRDGWITTMAATVRFSNAIDSATIDDEHVQVWDWNEGEAFRFTNVTLEVDEDDRRLSIIPPLDGWLRGHTYLIVIQGGDGGVRDAHGYGIEPDATFYYLRQNEQLNTFEHNRALPGATRTERLEKADQLEEQRLNLAPFFDFFESSVRPTESEIPRDEIAALWSFTVTSEPELAMDRDSQRVPLPFNLLLDRDSGLVDLREAEWDDQLERDAKTQANELDGFALSANLLFELTEAVDRASLDNRVHVFELEPSYRELPTTVRVIGEAGEDVCATTPTPLDCIHVVIEIDDNELPLQQASTYAVVVDRGVRSASGKFIQPMLMGWFLQSENPIAIDGVSQISSLDDESANRLEATRAEVDELLDEYGRENVLTAWSFTTLNAVPIVREAARMTINLDLDVQPTIIDRLEPLDALETLFSGFEAAAIRLIYLTRTRGIEEVIIGSLPSPYFLDPLTHRWREEYELQPLRFYLSIPENSDPSRPLPMVIFGHAIVTDARFMMTMAGELAQRGFATLAIDFPFHGERTACIDSSLIAVPNFLPDRLRDISGLDDDILRFPPCASGSSATCSAQGLCLTEDGQPDELTAFPLVSVQVASGAVFLDIEDLPHINDHFRQALVDLSTALHSIRTSDWESAIGYRLDGETIHYAGQSLGSIIGAMWVSVTPEIDRTVLNVPGADLVDLIQNSVFFGPQVREYFDTHDLSGPSYEKERLLDVARWLIDSVDPHSVAHLFAQEDRPVLLQMDRGDIVIPNFATQVLQRVSDRPMRVYPSSLHADLIIPVLGDAMLRDMGQFLSGEIDE